VYNNVFVVNYNAIIIQKLYFLSLRERIKVRVVLYPNFPRSGF
jgi:hypothetical protein